MRLRIKDFQAVIDAMIEVKGVTFLTGTNNQGKSSFMRGSHALVMGRPGADHIRKGAKKAIVAGEFAEDPDNTPVVLSWIKGKAGAKYEINGEPFMKKMGRRGVPLEDLSEHGLGEVDFSGGPHQLMFGLQDDPHFLVMLPATQIFDYVSKILKEQEIIPVIKRMGSDTLEIKSEATRIEGEILTRKGSVESWKEERGRLERGVSKAASFEDLHCTLVSIERMEDLRVGITEVSGHARVMVARLNEVSDFLGKAEAPLASLENDVVLLGRMETSLADLYRLMLNSKDISLKLEETKLFLERATPLDSLEMEILKQVTMEDAREKLLGVLSEESNTRRRLETLTKELSSLPDLEKAETLLTAKTEEEGLLQRMERGSRELRQVLQKITDTKEELGSAVDALKIAKFGMNQLMRDIGVCPTCGSKIGDCNE